MNTYATAILLTILATGTALAAGADNGCAFNPPQALLQSTAYAGYAFKRAPDNEATEKAQIRPQLRVEILMSQCVDSIVQTTTFIVQNAAKAQHDERYWIDFARTELAGLKRKTPAAPNPDLQQFLLHAGDIAPQAGKRSACVDGSKADAGECTWDSGGGYIFEVKKTGVDVRVSVTQYTSA